MSHAITVENGHFKLTMHKHLAQLSWRRFERAARSAAGRAANELSLSLPVFHNHLTRIERQDAMK